MTPVASREPRRGAMLTGLIAAAAAVGAVAVGLARHPHPIAPPAAGPPTPASLRGSAWDPAAPPNAQLAPVGTFLARGKVASAETVFLRDPADCDTAHATDSRGRVWRLAPAGAADQTPRLAAHVGGTLLGGAFDAAGGMYLADSTRGLLYVPAGGGAARIVAARAPSDLTAAAGDRELDGAEVRYANDIAIDRATGHVYFSDSSRIAPTVTSDRRGQTFLSYGTSHLAGDATGRLLVYVPATGECHVLATGIPFANGVGVSKDGSHVIVASTSSYTLFKVATLAAGAAPPAPRVAGDLERFYPGALPGMPDGLTVDDEDGSVFVPIFGPVPLMVRLVDRGPTWLRRLLVAMPYAFRPTKDAVYTMIAKFAPDGTLLRVWHDAEQRYGLLTSVARCEKYLYSGSLKGRHAARFDVSV